MADAGALGHRSRRRALRHGSAGGRAAGRAGAGARGGRRGGRARTPAARRRGRPPVDRHRGARRQGGGHRARHLLRAAVLRADPRLARGAAQARAEGRAPRTRADRRARRPLMRHALPLRSLTLVAAAVLAGCVNLAPDYQAPTLPVPQTLPSANVEAATPLDAGWRDFFVEPKLRAVIELALANNRDLRVAALNIERARAQYGIARAGF
eukprot:gene39093-44319_t